MRCLEKMPEDRFSSMGTEPLGALGGLGLYAPERAFSPRISSAQAPGPARRRRRAQDWYSPGEPLSFARAADDSGEIGRDRDWAFDTRPQ